MNVIDRLVGFVNPSAGLRRARARMALKVVKDHSGRRYEGAAKSRRTTGWKAESTSANAETISSLEILRNRHRDLVRNNPWARRAVHCVVTNTVGYGIEAAFQNRSKQRVKRITDLWKAWAESTQCDVEGRLTMAGVQAQIMRTVVESGEALVVRQRRSSKSGLAVPLQVQVLEPDQIDTLRQGTTDSGGKIVQGIEYDSSGKVVAYWLFPNHPGDTVELTTNGSPITRRFTGLRSVRVSADDVCHVFMAERPGQARGVPWGAAILIRLRDLDDYEDAYLLRQKLANCFTAFIADNDVVPGTANSDNVITESLEPGAIEILPNGKTVSFSDPPDADDYGPFVENNLYAVSSCYGITFEMLTGKMTNVNFSSGRMGWVEAHRNIECWRWQMLIPQALDRLGKWFLDAVSMTTGEAVEDVSIWWTPPRREVFDPSKEYKAMIDAARAGITSLPEIHRELGYDTDQVLKEISETNEAADKLGIVLETDARQSKGKSQEMADDEAETQRPDAAT